MKREYFAQPDVLESMQHDHLYLWLEMRRAVQDQLGNGVRIADLGCSSGEMLRMLLAGLPGLVEPVHASLAVGFDLPEMDAVLRRAALATRREMPIAFCHASLSAFPGQFDLIFSHEVLYLVSHLDALCVSAFAALRPRGVFCAATMGYSENPYYRRWLPLMRERNIPAVERSLADYTGSLQRAGFSEVRMQALLLGDAAYEDWKASRPQHDPEWFSSAEDERRYFTQVGKMILIARRGDD